MSASQNIGGKRQRGMGMVSVFAIIAASVFIGLFVIKVGPHYLENWTIAEIAEDVANDPNLLKQPRSKVYFYINKAYRTNNLWDVDAEETIKLKKDGQRGYIVTVQYEKRANLFHNIDLVTRFDTVTKPGGQ